MSINNGSMYLKSHKPKEHRRLQILNQIPLSTSTTAIVNFQSIILNSVNAPHHLMPVVIPPGPGCSTVPILAITNP
uniref:Uncharacterized protein n=1 Tax=Anguilla anguilla TaxID=7936 RepID=A0A0E9XND0_ANGAN